jgi:hypothetical protein
MNPILSGESIMRVIELIYRGDIVVEVSFRGNSFQYWNEAICLFKKAMGKIKMNQTSSHPSYLCSKLIRRRTPLSRIRSSLVSRRQRVSVSERSVEWMV